MTRKEEILAAGKHMFSKYGYKCSLSDIAIEVGIKKQTIYNYFDSKETLFKEVINSEIGGFFDLSKGKIDEMRDCSALEQLKNIYFLVMDYFSDDERHKLWRWMMLVDENSIYLECRKVIETHEKLFVRLLEAIIKKGQLENLIIKGDCKPMIHGFIVTIHGVLDGKVFYESLLDKQLFTQNALMIYMQGISVNKIDQFESN